MVRDVAATRPNASYELAIVSPSVSVESSNPHIRRRVADGAIEDVVVSVSMAVAGSKVVTVSVTVCGATGSAHPTFVTSWRRSASERPVSCVRTIVSELVDGPITAAVSTASI